MTAKDVAVEVTTATELASALLNARPDDPVVVLFGAAASNPRPSSLPFAAPWKALLLPMLARAAGAPRERVVF